MTTREFSIASPAVRVLAFSAGVIAAVMMSLSISPLFAVVPLPLILGAVLPRSSDPAGRILMWVGAALVSMITIPLGSGVFGSIGLLKRIHDVGFVLLLFGWIVSLLLTLLCDVALIIDVVKWIRVSASGTD
jgi:hypothetical protein